MPVVTGPGGGGVLFHEACVHGLEADLVAKGASVFAGRMGERVAAPRITLVDDGTLAEEWGAFAVDDEGSVASRNVLIEDGILTDYMYEDRQSVVSGKSVSVRVTIGGCRNIKNKRHEESISKQQQNK